MTPITPKDMKDSFLASSSMLSWRGVRFSSTSCIIEKMTPNSVSQPVAITIPEPLPLIRHKDSCPYRSHACHIPFRTRVPMKAIQVLSARATASPEALAFSCWHVAGSFFLASVSPVKLLSSTSRSTVSIRRMSAGIRSPVENLTKSPGTSSFASTCIVSPSLLNGLRNGPLTWTGRIHTVRHDNDEERVYSGLLNSFLTAFPVQNPLKRY